MKERLRAEQADAATRRRLSAVRLAAGALQPFLSEALYALQPLAVPGLGTFAVDEQLRLYVDPETILRWTVEQAAAVMLHEVGHVIRDHAGRARGIGVDETTHQRWNWAADAEINDDLVADGCELPPTPVLPSTFGAPGGKTAEFYFDRLAGRNLKWDLACGSGAHGNHERDPARVVELATNAGDSDKLAVASFTDGLSEVELTLLRKRIAEAVLAHGSTAGSQPGGWARWATSLGAPRINWRSELRIAVRTAISTSNGNSAYTFRRLPRRRVPGIVLPALERPQPIVSVVVDTSGSMSDDLLGAAWTEVLGVFRSIGVRRDLLRVYAGDVTAARVRGSLSSRVELIGGGGTDMDMAITQVLQAKPRPDLVVVLTDGYTPWPSKQIGRPLLAILFGTDAPPAPTWARSIRVPV